VDEKVFVMSEGVFVMKKGIGKRKHLENIPISKSKYDATT
jgi:hypothetical protein